MKFGDKDYRSALDSWLHDQFLAEEVKPQGMYGYWAWALNKTKEFEKLMRDLGKLR